MGKLNLDDVRASAKAVKAAKGGGKFFKCAEGKNVIRLFTYESAPRDGKTALERLIRRHYKLDGANPLCQKTPAPDGRAAATCEYCDRVDEIREEEGPKVAKRMEASKKYVLNVVPVMLGGEPVQGAPRMTMFDAPTSVIEAVFAVMEDSGNPDAYVGINGRDLAINYDPKADPKRMYTAMFRDETASTKTTAALKKVAAALTKGIVDLDSDPHLLPDWWKQEQGIEDAKDGDDDAGDKPVKAAAKAGKRTVAAPPPVEDADEGPAFEDTAPEAEDPGDSGAPTDADDVDATPPAEPEEDADDDVDPAYEGTLPKGVTAYWSSGKKKFYFKLPNGTTTFDEAAAKKAGGGPSKPPPPAAKAPAAKKAAAPAPAAKKKGGK